MAIGRDEVLHVARLARLDLREEEIERLTGELGAILDAVERHDPAAARDRMIAHVRTAGELVLHHFETVGEPMRDPG